MRGALVSLGIDPDSEKVERFNAGLITKEELLGISSTTPQQPQENLSAIEKFNRHKTSVEKNIREGKTPSAEDFLMSMQLTSDIAQEGVRAREIADMNVTLSQCESAAGSVIVDDELHKALPENIQEIEKQIFVGSTDYLMAKQTGNDPRYFNPQAYNFYAKQNLKESFNQLRNAWIEHGKKLASAPSPPPAPNQPNPISSSTGGGPMAQPQKMLKFDDGSMQQAARDYKPAGTRV